MRKMIISLGLMVSSLAFSDPSDSVDPCGPFMSQCGTGAPELSPYPVGWEVNNRGDAEYVCDGNCEISRNGSTIIIRDQGDGAKLAITECASCTASLDPNGNVKISKNNSKGFFGDITFKDVIGWTLQLGEIIR